MSTPLTELYGDLRHLLPRVETFEDSALAAGLKAMLRMGQLEGYALTADQLAITPDLTDPNDWCLLLYRTVLSFVQSQPGDYAWGTRALKERTGHYRDFCARCEAEINALVNGELFDSWTSLHTFLSGATGLPPSTWLRGAQVVTGGTASASESGIVY